jgi:hypothetical protein
MLSCNDITVLPFWSCLIKNFGLFALIPGSLVLFVIDVLSNY